MTSELKKEKEQQTRDKLHAEEVTRIVKQRLVESSEEREKMKKKHEDELAHKEEEQKSLTDRLEKLLTEIENFKKGWIDFGPIELRYMPYKKYM